MEAIRGEGEDEASRRRAGAARAELARVRERGSGAEHVGGEDEQVVLEERVAGREPDG